ncbi:MAG TPA: N-acetylmuramoyl-L-alanine amidase [Chitinophagaceae bacterium]|nr:N-acetylmuramoyl-L-alanine amidase [Chitinophagaceae bacterium]
MHLRVLFKAGLLIVALQFSQFLHGQTRSGGPKIKTIIVDAGHGGTDAGARGRYSTEAQITLQIALKLEEKLKEQLPDTRIVMTRRTDIFHNVREKANIANSNGGDLFVCVHVNAAPAIKHRELVNYKTVTTYTGKGKKRKKVTKKVPVYRNWTTPNPRYGTSTYVFAADRIDEKASGILDDERFESESEVVDVPDPSSPEAMIKARLWSQKFFKSSVRLASMIESEFTEVGRKSLGVLQRNEKGIWVLQATNMPAVLVETGFITNQEEEDYLNSDKGQHEISDAITKAVVNYKNLVDAPKPIGATGQNQKKELPEPQKNSGSAARPEALMPSGTKKGETKL